MNPETLFNIFRKNGIEFFTGVPDSTLKSFTFYLEDYLEKSNHVIAANEGNAIGIATGYHMSTGKIPLIYMQNSGFGNAINPLTSLADSSVFSIPLIILMGWRGEPGKKDAIQHLKDGQIQIKLLVSLGMPYTILSSDEITLEREIMNAVDKTLDKQSPHILLVRRNFFDNYGKKPSSTILGNLLSREKAISQIVNLLGPEDIVISTTGKASRELFEIRKKLNHNTENDFRVIGSMGHASSIALGVNLNILNRRIFCLDGDGSVIMHMGAMATIGKYSNSNFRHILLNNFCHESVGGQESSSDVIDFSLLSESLSYKNFLKISETSDFSSVFTNFRDSPGPSLLEIIISKDSRSNLGRPNNSPIDNKKQFMDFLSE